MFTDGPGVSQACKSAESCNRSRRPALQDWPWLLIAVAGLAALLLGTVTQADETVVPEDVTPRTFQGLDSEVQSLTQDVVDLNRDLFMLEEELLFPANTQVAIFVSMDVGTFFALDSVQILLDGKEITNYLYTRREVEALLRGGVHRVWLGNLKGGKHEMTAFFTGKGPHDRDYKRGAALQVDKGVGARYFELKISDRARQLQPEFIVKEWE